MVILAVGGQLLNLLFLEGLDKLVGFRRESLQEGLIGKVLIELAYSANRHGEVRVLIMLGEQFVDLLDARREVIVLILINHNSSGSDHLNIYYIFLQRQGL